MTSKTWIRASLAGAAIAVLATAAIAETAHHEQQRREGEIPHCAQKLGSIAVVEPDNDWWSAYHLASPEALIKVFVSRSNCFTLLDRGKGMAAIQRERELASGGQLRQGSNMGQGQIRAADYVLVPDLVSQNNDASGNAVGGILGGLVGGGAGAVLGGIDIKSKTADVVLTVTDVRSSEQKAMEEGHAKKTDVGWGAGGGIFGGSGFGAAGATGYDNTEIGQVIALAYLDAYTRLVADMGGLPENASDANVEQAVVTTRAARMYASSSGKGRIVRRLDPDTMLYPTGNKNGAMWEVKDELGNQGWVSSLSFKLAK